MVSIGGAFSWPGNSPTCIVYCRARGEEVRKEEGDNLDWEEGKDRQSIISQNLLELWDNVSIELSFVSLLRPTKDI